MSTDSFYMYVSTDSFYTYVSTDSFCTYVSTDSFYTYVSTDCFYMYVTQMVNNDIASNLLNDIMMSGRWFVQDCKVCSLNLNQNLVKVKACCSC